MFINGSQIRSERFEWWLSFLLPCLMANQERAFKCRPALKHMKAAAGVCAAFIQSMDNVDDRTMMVEWKTELCTTQPV